MSQQKNTNTTDQFNNQSMGVFNGLQSSIGNNLQQFMNNPLQSSFFQNQLGMATQANQQSFQQNNNAMMNNLKTGGFVGNMPAYAQSMMAQNSRGLSAANSNSFNNLLLGANQLRLGATQQAQGFRPLQTGQDQQQSVGGVGSWLPQIAGAVLGGGMSMLTGGLLGGGGGQGGGLSYMPGDNYGQPTGNLPTSGMQGNVNATNGLFF